MKFLAMALFVSMVGSTAMASCPESMPDGRLASKLSKNYDGTCTIEDPKLVDRGVAKDVAGNIDGLCFLFGFGVKAGVDSNTAYRGQAVDVISVDNMSASSVVSHLTNKFYNSITCRMSPPQDGRRLLPPVM